MLERSTENPRGGGRTTEKTPFASMETKGAVRAASELQRRAGRWARFSAESVRLLRRDEAEAVVGIAFELGVEGRGDDLKDLLRRTRPVELAGHRLAS